MRIETGKPGKKSQRKAAPAGELALLAAIRRRAAAVPAGLPLGIGDDCALLRLRANEELAITTDLSIAGRHFRLDWHPPESVGHRALARGLSDLAAMGARPAAAFLSLGLPRALTRPVARGRAWVERFLDGLLALAAAHRTPLAGGDLAQSPVALADIVLAGAVPRGRALLRSGARPGHLLYVTGSLGGAAAGLAGWPGWPPCWTTPFRQFRARSGRSLPLISIPSRASRRDWRWPGAAWPRPASI